MPTIVSNDDKPASKAKTNRNENSSGQSDYISSQPINSQQITEKICFVKVNTNNYIMEMIRKRKGISDSKMNLVQSDLDVRESCAQLTISRKALTYILETFFQNSVSLVEFSLTIQGINGLTRTVRHPFHDDSIMTRLQAISPDTKLLVTMIGVDIYANRTRTNSMIGIMSLSLVSQTDNQHIYSTTQISKCWPKKMPNPTKLHPTDQGKKVFSFTILPDKVINVGDEQLPPVNKDTLLSMIERILYELTDRDSIPSISGYQCPMTSLLPKARPIPFPPQSNSVAAPGKQGSDSAQSNMFDRSNLYHRQRTFINWPYQNIASARELASTGFYCTDDRERILCVGCCCKIEIRDLITPNFNPFQKHVHVSPNCRYVAIGSRVNSSTAATLQQPCNFETEIEEDSDNSFGSVTLDDLNFALQNTNIATNTNTCGSYHSSKVELDPSINHGACSDSGSRKNNSGIPVEEITENRRENQPSNSQSAVHQAEAYAYGVRNPQQSDPNSRKQTFRYWDLDKYRDIDKLVEAGFFYTGNDDIVRCFHCDIGLAEWNQTDDPWEEHARHSHKCPYLRERKSPQFIDEIQRAWTRVYTPKHPEYNEKSSRIRSFENSAWPRAYVSQTPTLLAEAGFYYTGNGDTVRCHYCDGGMREWEPNDDPWIEHARWFPFCKYVLKMKGIEFIRQCSTGAGSRPAESSPNVPSELPLAYTQQVEVMSYVEECKRKEIKNPLLTAAAQSVMEIGYSTATLALVINKYIATKGTRDFSADDLMYIIIDMEDRGVEFPADSDNLAEEISNGTTGPYFDENGEFELSPEAVIKENELLRKKFLCVLCTVKERNMVFVPCGHRITCEACASKQYKCMHCETDIDQAVKTFLC